MLTTLTSRVRQRKRSGLNSRIHTTRIELRDRDRGGNGRKPEEERRGGLVEEEGTDPELELDLSPRFGAVGAHEGLPCGRR